MAADPNDTTLTKAASASSQGQPQTAVQLPAPQPPQPVKKSELKIPTGWEIIFGDIKKLDADAIDTHTDIAEGEGKMNADKIEYVVVFKKTEPSKVEPPKVSGQDEKDKADVKQTSETAAAAAVTATATDVHASRSNKKSNEEPLQIRYIAIIKTKATFINKDGIFKTEKPGFSLYCLFHNPDVFAAGITSATFNYGALPELLNFVVSHERQNFRTSNVTKQWKNENDNSKPENRHLKQKNVNIP